MVLSFNNLADIAGSAIVSFSLLRMKELMSLVAFFMDGVLVEGEAGNNGAWFDNNHGF